MTLDTQMTIALLQELLLALRANDPDDFKAWLSLGIERLGKPAVIELLLDWMDPILTTEEADRLVGWHMRDQAVNIRELNFMVQEELNVLYKK